eukprot:9340783-Pyramimonas_sp.AAC.2
MLSTLTRLAPAIPVYRRLSQRPAKRGRILVGVRAPCDRWRHWTTSRAYTRQSSWGLTDPTWQVRAGPSAAAEAANFSKSRQSSNPIGYRGIASDGAY